MYMYASMHARGIFINSHIKEKERKKEREKERVVRNRNRNGSGTYPGAGLDGNEISELRKQIFHVHSSIPFQRITIELG